MSRKHYTDVIGTLGSGGLTNSATTHTFTALTFANGTAVPTLTTGESFLLSILDASGNVLEVINVTAYNSGTKVATIARGQEGTTAIAHAGSLNVANSAYPSDFLSGLLAAISYGPVTQASVNTSSGAMADIDASNLAVTFIAPPSGKVSITVGAWVGALAAATIYNWGLREGSTTVADRMFFYNIGGIQGTFVASFLISGLTPGSSHTYKFAHRNGAGTGPSGIQYRTGDQEAWMSVQAVP